MEFSLNDITRHIQNSPYPALWKVRKFFVEQGSKSLCHAGLTLFFLGAKLVFQLAETFALSKQLVERRALISDAFVIMFG